MSLLREIRDAAVDGNTSLTVVLRKSMVLAAGLGHAGFKKWVEDELNGYAPDAELPSYRRVEGISSIGTFVGPFGEQIKNLPLALAHLPETIRGAYSCAEFRAGVAELEAIGAGTPHHGKLISRWPGDLVAAVATNFINGRSLIEAHREIPVTAILEVLGAVRNKALKFVLEIEEQAPDAGEVAPGSKPVPVERVAHIFNTYVMGGAQNVAVGSPGALQHAR